LTGGGGPAERMGGLKWESKYGDKATSPKGGGGLGIFHWEWEDRSLRLEKRGEKRRGGEEGAYVSRYRGKGGDGKMRLISRWGK